MGIRSEYRTPDGGVASCCLTFIHAFVYIKFVRKFTNVNGTSTCECVGGARCAVLGASDIG